MAFTNAAHEGHGDLNTQTGRLRMLEAEGRVHRHYEPTAPPRVTYSLTDEVMELDGVLKELAAIADGWYGRKAKKPG